LQALARPGLAAIDLADQEHEAALACGHERRVGTQLVFDHLVVQVIEHTFDFTTLI
jgi:hypothetical protein